MAAVLRSTIAGSLRAGQRLFSGTTSSGPRSTTEKVLVRILRLRNQKPRLIKYGGTETSRTSQTSDTGLHRFAKHSNYCIYSSLRHGLRKQSFKGPAPCH